MYCHYQTKRCLKFRGHYTKISIYICSRVVKSFKVIWSGIYMFMQYFNHKSNFYTTHARSCSLGNYLCHKNDSLWIICMTSIRVHYFIPAFQVQEVLYFLVLLSFNFHNIIFLMSLIAYLWYWMEFKCLLYFLIMIRYFDCLTTALRI